MKDFLFPKTKFRSRNRFCQHNWFDNYLWLHYDIEEDCVFRFSCMKNLLKLTAEKTKELVYKSVGFKNWKKILECFNLLMPGVKNQVTRTQANLQLSAVGLFKYV